MFRDSWLSRSQENICVFGKIRLIFTTTSWVLLVENQTYKEHAIIH